MKYDWFEESTKNGDWRNLWSLFKKLFANRDLLYRSLRTLDPASFKDFRGLVGTWAALAGSAWVTQETLPEFDRFKLEFSQNPNLWIEKFLNR